MTIDGGFFLDEKCTAEPQKSNHNSVMEYTEQGKKALPWLNSDGHG